MTPSDTDSDIENLRRDVERLISEVSSSTILPRYQNLSDADVNTKSGPGDLVTIADQEAERLITAGLSKVLPGSQVIGEEAAAEDSSILSRLSEPEPVWVIDPIDGTANFVSGTAAFAVIVGLVQGGRTVMGWIHEPLEAKTIWAGEGQGTWLGQRRLTIDQDIRDVSTMVAALYHRAFKKAKGSFGRVWSVGSAAHEYWALVENRLDISTFSRLMPWDHAAGVLIHTEAGGYSRMMDGSLYSPANDTKLGLLSAPSAEVWAKVRALADEHYV